MKHRRIVALFLALAMTFALIGCGGNNTSTNDGSGVNSSSTGDEEIVFNFTLNRDLYSMNLGGADSGAEPTVFHLMYDRLIKRETDGTLTPRLWTSWEPSEDGLSYTVKLREGVTFHNGEPFTAESMKATFEWWATDTTLSLHPTWAKIKEVEVVDDHTCIFHFSEVDALFITNITGVNGYVEPKAFAELGVDKYFEHPYGCGMYSFVSWDPGNELILARDPNYTYWDTSATTNIDKYVINSVSEDITRVSSLQTGESDLIMNVPFEQLGTLNNTQGVKVEQIQGTNTYWLGVECGDGYIFNDPKLRQAVSECLDRETIAKSIFGIAGAIDWYVPPYCNAYDPQYSGQYYQYNPENAKKLVAESDYDGTPIRLIAVNSFPKITELSQAMVSMLKDAGFEVDLQMIEHSALNETRGSGAYDIFISSYAFGADASFFLQIQIVNDRGHFELNNQEINELILAANQVVDDEERAEMMREVCKMCAEIYGPQIPLFTMETTMAVKDNVSGYELQPNEAMDLMNMVVN